MPYVETGSKLFVVWMAVVNAHFLYLYASFGSFYAVQGLHCARNLRLLVLFYSILSTYGLVYWFFIEQHTC
jgi:hypothetical protein